MPKPTIKVENLSKQYRLGNIGTGSLSNDLKRWWHQARGKEDPFLRIGETNNRSTKGDSEYVWALKDINFEVMPGEILGIIGKNGAGKSTLLKILSKVTGPTTGCISYNGRIGSLLEVGTGFHPELTGRENIFLNGAILGMTKAEIRSKLDEIIDFSGCERYIDTPVKRYSSGMMVRLGFAVAAHLEPEILVVDEVLAVGDAEFQKKAIGKMQDVSRNEGRTVLFVSHNMGSMQQLCSSGILLERGGISYSGSIETTVKEYLFGQNSEIEYVSLSNKVELIYINKIVLYNSEFIKQNIFLHTENIDIVVNLIFKEKISGIHILITILDQYKRKVFSADKSIESDSVKLRIKNYFLTRGTYSLQVILYKPGVTRYDCVEDTCPFEIVDAGSSFAHLETFDYGVVFGSFDWQNSEETK